MSIDGPVISSGEMVCEGTYFFLININSHYYVLQKNKPNNTIISLKTIINGNVKVKCYELKDDVKSCLPSISQKYYITISPLLVPMEEHDNIMDKKNQREII